METAISVSGHSLFSAQAGLGPVGSREQRKLFDGSSLTVGASIDCTILFVRCSVNEPERI